MKYELTFKQKQYLFEKLEIVESCYFQDWYDEMIKLGEKWKPFDEAMDDLNCKDIDEAVDFLATVRTIYIEENKGYYDEYFTWCVYDEYENEFEYICNEFALEILNIK